MKIIRKKVVMIGSFGVGKTSLVRRFVSNEFSDSYLSTIGVRTEKSTLNLGDVELELMLWDLAGHDDFARLQPSYLRGAAGALLIADSSRGWTVLKAQELKDQYQHIIPDVPWQFVLNKSDLPEGLSLAKAIKNTEFDSPNTIRTSAKTGDGVLAAFKALAEEMMQS